MRNIFNFLIVFCLSVAQNSSANAVIPESSLKINTDSNRVVVRTFDSNVLATYRTQKDFQYGSSYQTAESLWSRFWRWFWDYYGKALFGVVSNNVTMVISIVISTAVIIYVITRFFGVGIQHIFTGKAKPVALPYFESSENIHGINFDPEIENAINNRDYRLAVRMLYLKCLKRLSDSGLISWQINKTNSNYIDELDNSERKEKFAVLTNRFEYIWYGESNINQSIFLEIHNDFKDFNKGL